jgi:hypothetical protein
VAWVSRVRFDTIGFTAESGRRQCSGEVIVGVPHDQRKGATIIHGCARYDPTIQFRKLGKDHDFYKFA